VLTLDRRGSSQLISTALLPGIGTFDLVGVEFIGENGGDHGDVSYTVGFVDRTASTSHRQPKPKALLLIARKTWQSQRSYRHHGLMTISINLLSWSLAKICAHIRQSPQ
jgi:hypothetical protein